MTIGRRGFVTAWAAALTGLAALLVSACDRDDSGTAEAGLSEQTSPTGGLDSGNQAEHDSRSGSPKDPVPQPVTSGRVTRPAPSSTSKPAKPHAARVAPFRPLLDAVVGEWVRYAAMDGRSVHYEIVELGATGVMTRVEVFDHGKPVGLPAVRKDAPDLDPLARQAGRVRAERVRTRADIEAAGRKWDAFCYEDRWVEEGIRYLRRTWVSPEVPVFGTILMELHGDGVPEARLELTKAGVGSRTRQPDP